MASGYEITRVWGIPIKLHITLLLALPFFLIHLMGIGLTLIAAFLSVVLLFASVALHELGHSRAAHHYGYRVREILLLPIGGVAMLEQMPRKPIEEFVIAIAGPAVSLGLAITSLGLVVLCHQLGLIAMGNIFQITLAVNAMLCLFNLIPSFPMDGGRIFRAFMSPRVGRVRATYLAAKAGRIFAIAFGFIGLFGLPGVIKPFSLSLILIAMFIYYAAGSEYRGVVMQERMRAAGAFPGDAAPIEDDTEHHFSAGPAPYEQKGRKIGPNVFRQWFDDLFEDYDRRS